MVNYFKTQWWRIGIAILCWIPIIVVCCTSTATTETVDGLATITRDLALCFGWLLASCCWLLTSLTSHNSDCIQKLNSRVTDLENYAITSIDEVSPGHYRCVRQLGEADKNYVFVKQEDPDE